MINLHHERNNDIDFAIEVTDIYGRKAYYLRGSTTLVTQRMFATGFRFTAAVATLGFKRRRLAVGSTVQLVPFFPNDSWDRIKRIAKPAGTVTQGELF